MRAISASLAAIAVDDDGASDAKRRYTQCRPVLGENGSTNPEGRDGRCVKVHNIDRSIGGAEDSAGAANDAVRGRIAHGECAPLRVNDRRHLSDDL